MTVRNFFLTCTLILLAFGFYSCIKCQCEPVTTPDFDCTFINRQGQNLVFGSQAIYKLDSLKVLKNRNDFSVQNASIRRSYRDSSSIGFDFYIYADKSYVYFNQSTNGDVLEITWRDEKRKCCGEPFIYHAIEQVRFNGAVVQPQNGIYIFAKP